MSNLLLKRIGYFMVGALLLTATSLHSEKSYALDWGGSTILHGNCDPAADPMQDDVKVDGVEKEDYQKSCIGQGIDINSFKVTVQYGLSIVGVDPQQFEVELGGSTSNQAVKFTAELEGDKVCVYANLGANYSVPRCDSSDTYSSTESCWTKQSNSPYVTDGEMSERLPTNCMYAPEMPDSTIMPNWSNMISTVCLDYDTSASNFKYKDEAVTDVEASDETDTTTTRSFTGVVVQCIEDSMMNIFYNKNDQGNTFFSSMQIRMLSIIRGLLALYIIFFGYKMMIEKKVSQSEAIWLGLKFGLVLYFAAGTGMIDMLPKIQTVSRELSTIVMEASFGSGIEAEKAKNDVQKAQESYDLAREELTQARYQLAQARYALTKGQGSQSEVDSAMAERDAKQIAADSALTVLNSAKSISLSLGYDYCDFRSMDYNTSYTDVNGVTTLRDMNYMRLWDMMDCKLSKYLGVGDNSNSLTTPHVLVIAVTSIFTNIYGFPIFICAIVFLVFLILVTLRIMHVYIIAFIALVILVYMSPLVIPAVLFEKTKGIFNSWFKQVIAYSLQPVILFAFLAFLFSAYDSVMYGKNYDFVPMTQDHANDVYENKMCMVQISTGDPVCEASVFQVVPKTDLRCVDSDAMGCVYQKIVESYMDIGFGLRVYQTNMTEDDGKIMVIGFLKLILVSIIAFAVLDFVEAMSTRLVDAVGGGAVSMAAVPKVNPADANKMTMNILKRGGGALKKGGSAMHASHEKSKAKAVTNRAGAMQAASKAMDDKKGKNV